MVGYCQQPVMYRYIDVSGNRVSFTCGGRLWIMDRATRQTQALDIDQMDIQHPLFSPDGKSIAYSAVVQGNTDVYVLSLSGGPPRRLTWHPGKDMLRSWSGNRIVYSSAKASAPARFTGLYEIDLTNGGERRLPFIGSYCQIAPDSSYAALVESEDIMETVAFKAYRGGNTCRIQLKNNKTGTIQAIPNSGWNDLSPVWVDRNLYFISDRGGIRNIYKYDQKTANVSQLTAFSDYDVHSLSTDGQWLAFEKGGRLFLLEPGTRQLQCVLPILPEGDIFPGKRPYTVSGTREIRSVSITADGSKLALDYRGDILETDCLRPLTFKNITQTATAHEQEPAWSQDGRLAYLSDAGGEYQLVVQKVAQSSDFQSINLGEKGYFSELRWSPDGQKIALCDQRRRLLMVDINKLKIHEVARDSFSVFNENQFNCHWSPDSRLMVYQMRCKDQLNRLVIFNTVSKRSDTLTKGVIDARFPVFRPDGKALYFAACKDNDLPLGQLDMSAFDRDRHWDIYRIDLPEEGKSTRPYKIYGDVVNLSKLEVTADDHLFFITVKDGSNCLMTCDPKTGNTTLVRPHTNDFQLASRGNKIFCINGKSFCLLNASAPYRTEEIDLSALSITVIPASEWSNAFYEALRLVRDFYRGSPAPDLTILRNRYEPLLPLLSCQEDFKYLLRQMLGELKSSHVFFFSPPRSGQTDEAIGLLAADWKVVQDHYRLNNIYHGDIWGATVQNPLDRDSIRVKAGDYLVSVGGKPVSAAVPPEALLKGTAGKRVTLGFNSRPVVEGQRLFTVMPVNDDSDLRRWQWVMRNRFLVDSVSKGRVGYIYLSDTHRSGYRAFKRDFAYEAVKEFLIIDARFNAGGYFPDYMIDMLGRRPLVQFHRNHASSIKEPLLSSTAGMMLLVNHRTISGGEILAAEFRQRGLGLIAGVRTAGLANPYAFDHLLLDGTTLVLPTLELADLHRKSIIENKGLDPDVILPGDPEDPAAELQLLQAVKQFNYNK